MSKELHTISIFAQSGCLNLEGLRGHAEGTLHGEQRSMAKAHIDDCELCKEAVGGFSEQLPDSAILAALGSINSEVAKQTGPAPGSSAPAPTQYPWMSIAASITLIATMSLFLFLKNDSSQMDDVFVKNFEAYPAPELQQDSWASVEEEKLDAAPFKKEDGQQLQSNSDRRDDLASLNPPVQTLEDLEVLDESEISDMVESDELGGGDFIALNVPEEEIEDEIVFAEDFDGDDDWDDAGEFDEEIAMDETAKYSVNDPINSTYGGIDNNQDKGKLEAGTETKDQIALNEISAKNAIALPEANLSISEQSSNEVSGTVVNTAADSLSVNMGYQTDVYNYDGDNVTWAQGNAYQEPTNYTKNEDIVSKKVKENNKKNRRGEKSKTSNYESREMTDVVTSGRVPQNSTYYDSDGIRYTNVQALMDNAIAKYNVKNYASAAELFEQIIFVEPANPEARFYGAVSYLETDQLDKAAKHLDFILEQENHKFTEQAYWYKSLLLIRRKNKLGAKQMLNDIIESDGFYKEQAKEAIEDLDR